MSILPTQKVAIGVAAGAFTTVVVWVVQTWGHVTIPAYVAASMTTLLTFIASWITPGEQ